MRRVSSLLIVICTILFIGTGCSIGIVDDLLHTVKEKDIQLTNYAKEIGFSLTTPETDFFEVETVVEIQGNVEDLEVNWNHLWIEIIAEESIESDQDTFDYYVPIENKEF